MTATQPGSKRPLLPIAVLGPAHPSILPNGPFNPYLGAGTIATRKIAGMPLDPNSANIAAWAAAHTPLPGGSNSVTGRTWNGGFGGATSLNTSNFNIPIYLVDSTSPACEYAVMACGGASATASVYLNGRIPIPSWMTLPDAGDQSFALYDVGTGIMREYFYVVQQGDGSYVATSGGYSVNTKGLANLATDNYALQLAEGSSAVAAMHNPLTQIGIAEAITGQISHALSFTCGNAAWANGSSVISWPAQGSDGFDNSGNAFAEGQWMTLPATLDLSTYHPFTQVIIKAVQTYGAYSADKNLFVNAFNGEHGAPWQHAMGLPTSNDYDPWKTIIGPQYGRAAGQIPDITDFPWALTQWAPVNWDKANHPTKYGLIPNS